jgi:hypothetical protein
MEKLAGVKYINCKKLKLCGSHRGDHEEYYLLGCDAKHFTKSSENISEEHSGSMFRVKE